jgi:hypothetical protein
MDSTDLAAVAGRSVRIAADSGVSQVLHEHTQKPEYSHEPINGTLKQRRQTPQNPDRP